MPAATDESTPRRSPARERLLKAATELFYAEGIKGVGVDRIVKAADVTLATFYRHFPSKGDLVVAYLRSVHEAIATRAEATQAEGRDLVAEIGDEVVAEIGYEAFRGCAFINAASEFEDPDSPARQVVAEHRAWYLDRLRRAFAEAGHERPGNAARHFVMLRDGAVTAGYLDSPTAAQRTFRRGVKGLIRAIDVDHMPGEVDEG
jgi:AcrR family transcriptional regulator